jgi:hypothetical protein
MRVRGAVAAGYCAFLSMAAGGWMFLGRVGLGDWDGYRAMYDRGGGYLVTQGRDPIFGWIIDRSFDVFGGGAYDIFRFALFTFFAFLAGAVAFFGVLEGSLIFASVVVSIDAFALKSLVQIREGIAFVAVTLPTALLSTRGSARVIGSAIGSVIAVFIHVGTFVFLLVWVVALGLRLLPVGPSNFRLLPGWLTSAAVLGGVTIGLFISQNAQLLERALRQFGVAADGPVTVSAWKYLYWAAMGVVVVVIRMQVASAHRDSKDFRSLYALTLGTGLVPLLYTTCVFTIMTQFKMAAVAAMQIRLLLTALELSLLVIVMRGRANALTGFVAATTLADQMRLILVP